MKNTPLGNTAEEVSELCLGTMHFGSATDTETSFQILDHYLEAGGTFLDTANNYATWVPGCKGGESESLLGKWMQQRNNRSRLFIASKVGFPAPVDHVGMGLSASQIQGECERSLKRLGIETIDLYYAHHDDRQNPLEERLEAFDKLIRAGKVRFIGASNTSAWRLEEARWISQTTGWHAFCCVQQRLTYLRPKRGADFDPQLAANDDLIDYCRNRQISLLAYTPLLKGAYSRSDRPLPQQYTGSDSDARLAALTAVAEEIGATLHQIVLAWLVQSQPLVISVIGASRPEQLAECLKALDLELSEAHISRLSTAGNMASSHRDAKKQRSMLDK